MEKKEAYNILINSYLDFRFGQVDIISGDVKKNMVTKVLNSYYEQGVPPLMYALKNLEKDRDQLARKLCQEYFGSNYNEREGYMEACAINYFINKINQIPKHKLSLEDCKFNPEEPSWNYYSELYEEFLEGI
ncbi:hypothetical protein GW932_01725 [archaeon]|nr:hypothetical protein [archaeon]